MQVSSFLEIVQALNNAKVRYLIVGGLATNAHGFVRMTLDVDLVIALDEKNILTALKTLAILGYQPVVPITPEEFCIKENRERWHLEKNMLVLRLFSEQHPRTPVDIFVKEPFPFEEVYLKAHWETLEEGINAPFVDLETLFMMKEKSGREKDKIDILALRKIHCLQ